MRWTECPLIEQIPGKLSGAPVLRGTRVRPEDIVANVEMGADWIADAHGLRVEDVQAILAFHDQHHDELAPEYISPAWAASLGADHVDWSACPLVSRKHGEPVIQDTSVRPVDLIAHASEGAEQLARIYQLPLATVRSVLAYFQSHGSQLAPAV